MDTQQLIGEMESERDRLDAAIHALRGGNNGKTGPRLVRGRGKRHLSPAAKKRISEQMKKRWAERKRATKAA